ncbi:hypothetical protein FC093_10290 [Ilyomonas limi]|uniref:Uncharacterized protein n=1 Tax=Ilyomonas limi TaxID=2575867 RepID=A0A4V5UVR6_9BACT|nr:hypothetical protein [Ilyomonas limi]TKK68503.1 hypothetical protein FC093_10290 [Ilyomonas limi]
MKLTGLFFLLLLAPFCHAQDTTVILENKAFMLPEVIVHSNMDYASILKRIQDDTTFYKAFRTLHTIGFSAYNDIRMLDKNGNTEASYSGKTTQYRNNGCRTMQEEAVKTTGDFYDASGNYNYITAQLYASLFFTHGKVCGENNIVAGINFNPSDKKGMEKHKEQLKMLFFNPGRRIPGVPFIGNKLDLYDEEAHDLYDYHLDYVPYKGSYAYVFDITPKNDLGFFQKDNIVIDKMTTWFDASTMEVLARNYQLSYKAGVYDFNVTMEIEMTKVDDLLVPAMLRYKGSFYAMFKGRERGEFTATLFDFKKEK